MAAEAAAAAVAAVAAAAAVARQPPAAAAMAASGVRSGSCGCSHSTGGCTCRVSLNSSSSGGRCRSSHSTSADDAGLQKLEPMSVACILQLFLATAAAGRGVAARWQQKLVSTSCGNGCSSGGCTCACHLALSSACLG